MKKNRIGKLSRAISFIALIIALFTVCFVGVFARYSTSFSGVASATTAKFDVDILSIDNPVTKLQFNEYGAEVKTQEFDYVFSIKSNSDVAVIYSVILKFGNAPFANVSLKISNGITAQTLKCDGQKKEFVFEGFNYAIGGETQTLTLTVIVDYINGDKLIDFNTFTDTVNISVIAEQKAPTN